MIPIQKIRELISDIPKGSCVALAHDYTHVASYGADLKSVIREAQESGENNPVIVGVPKTGVFLDGDTRFQVLGLAD